MKNNASVIYGFCLVILDFLALLGAFVGAYIVRVKIDDRSLIEFVSARSYFSVFLILVVFWILIFALLGLYNSSIYEKRFKEFGRLLIGSFFGLLFILSVAYFSKKTIFPARLVPVYGFIFAFSLLVIFRNVARGLRGWLFKYGVGINNTLLVGNSPTTTEFINLFADKSSGYRIVGTVGYKDTAYRIRSYENFEQAKKYLKPSQIHSIIQTELYKSELKNNQVLEYAQNNHISYKFVPGNAELFTGNLDVELFRGSIPIIAVNQTALSGWGKFVKRLFDLFVSTILFILLLPFMLILVVLLVLSDFGVPIFTQKRVTRYNKIFKIYKFRTVKKKYNGLSPEEAFIKMGKPNLIDKFRKNGDQLKNDPRFTQIGKLMRTLSLDELPQLLNIIKGDISLVGPRALVPEELSQAWAKNHIVSVKAGLTGLAQVSGRKDISFEQRRKLDLFYVQNWTFWLDIAILIKTLRVIINGRNAN
jgi:exopolysaccharide biosynthesis polyprenyl glycosylphosphotransferase